MRLLHFADTHIGVESYGRFDPETGQHTRHLDFARCLERAVDLALEHGVDAALFAGDAYRTATPTPTHQQLFAGAISRLLAADVPVVMVTGNHDLPLTYGRASALDIFATFAPAQVTVVRRPELVTLATRSGPLQVACLPWPTRTLLVADEALAAQGEQAVREAIEARCRAVVAELAQRLDPALPAVLLGHVTALNASFTGSEKSLLGAADPVLATGVLADPRYDYVALGHVHRYQQVNPGGRPAVVYCGSLERLDFGEAGDPKGVCLVDIGPGASAAERTTTHAHVETPARVFIALSYELPATAEPTEWLLAKLGGLEVREAIVRVRYTCTDEQYDALDLRAVRTALAEAHLVAGLIREKPLDARRPRVEITEHHGTLDALGRYLDTKPDLAPLREALLTAGARLEDELTRREAAGELGAEA